MIKPTVGRVVWFYPIGHPSLNLNNNLNAPLAAIIAYVWSDVLVNLAVFDCNGNSVPHTSIVLEQDEVPAPPGQSYCTWMPYQKGQAAKTEALEAKLGGQ